MNNNIVYILLDQVRLDMLGTYGHKIVKTPNMDAIAADGVRFNNAFTPASVCGPARTSLFTGQMPSNHELMRNSEKGGEGDPKLDNPNIISGMGDYANYLIGKWHVGKTVLPRDFGFRGHNFDGYGYPGSRVYKNMVFDQGPKQEPRYVEWLKENNFEIPEVTNSYFGENPHLRVQELCGRLSGTREATLPFFVVDEAKKAVLEAKKENKPFFIWMNFWGPHTPCVIPEPYYSMYKPEDVNLDESFYNPMNGKPLHYKDIAKMWGVWEAPEEKWKEIICKFWGYITLIDDAIGEFVKFLKEEGLYEQLFMAITADHGDAMGAHRLIEKGEFMFDTTYRIPMIVKDPCSDRKGEEDNNFVYLHDLTSTCYDVAGKEIPSFFDGESMLPILREHKNNDRKGILGQLAGHFVFFEQRMWRRDDYKIVFNATDVGELYDIKNDKGEINNLFYNPEYADIKKEMLEELYDEMVKIKDPLANWLYRIIYEI